MANIKSAQKSIRKIQRRTEHNRSVRSKLKTLAKNAMTAEGEAAAQCARAYLAALDKAAKTGVVHQNKADRHKARFAAAAFGKTANAGA